MRKQERTSDVVRTEPEGDTGLAGDRTRDRILDAAVEVLRDVGYGHFSVQKVARHAGVYQGNITYYWPRRRDLVLALALRVVEDYRRACLASLARESSAPAGRADVVVRSMVEEAVRPELVRILPELWSMANTDPEIARAVIGAHDEVLDAMLEAMGLDGDAPSGWQVRRILVLIGAAIQGLTAVHGHRDPEDPVLGLVQSSIVAHHAELVARAIEADRD